MIIMTMNMITKLFLKSLFLMLCFSFHGFSAETDTITSGFSIRDPDFLVSTGQVFKLGFFSPQNTTNRYLAIFYVVSENTTIWVANRDNPLTDTSGIATISNDGNLILVNGRNQTIWSTNATSAPANTTAQILDTGNLVLRDVSTGNVIWDFFSHPSNIFMPGMMLKGNTNLSSWKSLLDPGVGDFITTMNPLYIPQIMTFKNGQPRWRSGPYNGKFFIGIKEMYLAYPAGGLQVGHDSSDIYFTMDALRFLMKTDLSLSGSLVQYLWDERNKSWKATWDSNQNECDLYGKCGPFGICNPLNSTICSCLGGYEPANRNEWGSGNWTSGCTRRTQLQCDRESQNGDDVFLRMSFIKLPDFARPFPAKLEDECKATCLRNCSCLAYAHDSGIGCMFWSEILIDIQQFNNVGLDFYIRLASSDNNNVRKLVIIIPIVMGFACLSICIFIAWCCMAKKKAKRDQKALETLHSESTTIVLKDESEKVNIEELPLFTFKTLADATNQFHDDNMLGKGGFGYVYKGTLANGNDIAVKRLSANSGQGGEEFRNEAIVISKVQHRNLVKLLGCCVEGEEKILVYEYLWDERNKSWKATWDSNQNECDLYGKCGPFGICNPLNSTICSCLGGYEPAKRNEWGSGNWTSGCTRRTQLQCDRESQNGDDVFLRMSFIKLPDFARPFPAKLEDECRATCLRNCSCLAYAHDSGIGCMFWSEILIDIQQFDNVGPDFYIRLASSDNNNVRKLVIIIPIVVGVACLSICIFIAWCCMAKKKAKSDQKALETFHSGSTTIVLKDESEKVNIEELPLFTFKRLADATNQFHDDNMLGKGGFGYVYKGTLANGNDIAVKRLSANSGQGGEEFRNEAIVISKVQHRNLVKLLGCCVEGEEKILVYEYMSNKSLDICLFDPTYPSREILDWMKRFHIVEGIGRGLLYLHMESRLKIIHRDLKTSNVLLDGDWNPKISDFGMARIFGENQDQDNTARVVGTYGYMAPEYAIDGRFSEKSDVYSFGVLMLEIVSGQKNTHYYNQEWSLSLLGCAWKKWNEGNGIDFADQMIVNSSLEAEIVRCIHIALLCIQEFPKDRPTVEMVVSMLNLEIVDLPLPDQPLFAEKWGSGQPTSQNGYSINKITITVLDGR